MQLRLQQLGYWLRTNWIILSFAALTVAVAISGVVIARHLLRKPVSQQAAPATVAKPPEPAKAEPIVSRLTGAVIDASVKNRPATAVVIENHTDSRPQTALGQAGVVYEALAEGGITRFLAFFLENRPAVIGPVRSLRTYFVSWALEFDAPIAHVGGNADALDLVIPLKLKDMSQFSYPAHFYRTRDRYSPHNMYTSSDLLDQLEAKLKNNQPASFKPSPRKPDNPSASPNAGTIDISYSYPSYHVQYRYDAASNSYLRFMAGAPHIDRLDGAQIKTKNIVVQYMPTAYGVTRIGEQTVRMGDSGLPIGSGRAMVFRDGVAVDGTWIKSNNTERTKLVDTKGAEIPLNIGNTWYSIVPVGRSIGYK